MVLFSGPTGRVIAVNDPAVQGVLPPLVKVGGSGGVERISFQDRKALITRIAASEGCNAQFTHTLGGDIYVYVFGDRMGQVSIGGLCVAHDCERNGDREHGFEKMRRWFHDHKISRRADPVTVQLGQSPLRGFVTNFDGAVANAELYLMQFELTMALIPEND